MASTVNIAFKAWGLHQGCTGVALERSVQCNPGAGGVQDLGLLQRIPVLLYRVSAGGWRLNIKKSQLFSRDLV